LDGSVSKGTKLIYQMCGSLDVSSGLGLGLGIGLELETELEDG